MKESNNSSLTIDQLLEIVRLKEQEELSTRTIASQVGCSASTVSRFLSRKTHPSFWESHDEDPLVGGSMIDPIDKRIQHTGSKVIVITAAQNNTHVHKRFVKAIHTFMGHRDADLYVSTNSYAKKSYQKSEKGDGWYDAEIRDYIVDKPVQLAPGLVYCGEMNIIPTAVNPLSGLQGYAKGNSAIFGASKQAMESLPAPKHSDPTFMYTTGVVTQRNYIQRKAGQKAEFHHIFGALIVEITDEGQWFVRQINAESDTGNFYDLDCYYTAEGVTTGHQLAGLVPGDIHTNNIHPEIARETLGVDTVYGSRGKIEFNPMRDGTSIVECMKPQYVMCHDILDFKVRNHHNRHNPHFKFQQHVCGDESIEVELGNVASLLKAMEEHATPVVVSSNHDRALIRYIVDNVRDWSDDPVNALFFLRTQLEAYERMERGEYFDPVSWNIDLIEPNLKAIWLKQDEEFKVAGIACENHGDTGPNGSRGSLNGFVKMGVLMSCGHSHTAGIKDGVHQSGITCKKDPDYAKGPSSWSWSHGFIYPNGKRAMITMVLDSRGQAIWHN